MTRTEPTLPTPARPASRGLVRLAAGGALMGLANLVPGISGGTMLVATGSYRRFIEAVADLARLRWRWEAVVAVGTVAAAAAVAIGVAAGWVAEGLVQARWAMYSVFIGLTLGGAPLLWRMLAPRTRSAWAGIAIGAAAMAAIALLPEDADAIGDGGGVGMLFLGGTAGAAAMILPGVSGAYLLLLLGQYQPIIESIRGVTAAVSSRDLAALSAEAATLLPVGVGVVVGIAAVSNLLRWLLARFEKFTIGSLLGLLLAAPLGLYPFKEGVPPTPGSTYRGVVLSEAAAAEVPPKSWPQVRFAPTLGQGSASLALAMTGFMATMAVSRLGASRDPAAGRLAEGGADRG